MPELPEVETVMRGLDGYLTGRVIARATLHRPDLRFPVPKELPELLTGATVSGFRRRGKYMFMRLDRGMSVLIHLGMSGRMVVEPVGRNDIMLHEHIELETEICCLGGVVACHEPTIALFCHAGTPRS